MAAVPLSSASLLPLLECLEDEAAGLSEKTDAYITIANRSYSFRKLCLCCVISPADELCFSFQVHISSENEGLCQAALQALGFCVFHSHIVSVIPANISEDILSTLCNVVVKSKEKFTCTRALWVISKQNFTPEVASKKVPEILKSLEAMRNREVQSILIEHESLNVVIRLLEQAPSQMAAGAVCWANLVIPLVVHSANKVRLRAAAALELGMPLLLEKQQEVAAIVEPMMSSMLIPEMQKLFASKNETNMLKLWPLFVRLLGKVKYLLLHKGGAFINSLLYLEELGFRNSSPNIKKIAFIAWKSLIDNFALNSEILCSSKRLKLLMQPLSSIQVRTEALLLTKLEVWWYLVVKLGPNLSTNFEQVGVPLLHSALPSDSPLQSPATPARTPNPSNGIPSCSTPSATPRMNLNSSVLVAQSYCSIQLLGLEMLLHWLVGPEVTETAARENLQLSLEPLTHPLFTSPSSFSRHASTLISAVKEGFITVGKHAPEALLNLIWSNLICSVSTTIEACNKKERQGSEVLTLLLQALQSILSSDVLPAERALLLLEATVNGIPQKVLGSAAYQVANMDVLNGTPALFLILLIVQLGEYFLASGRFFSSLETLVSCGFCGPTSPLAFGEAVLGAISGSVEAVKIKKQLWRMWSVVVNPLTDTITQTNEVNQGDALEHNFSAIYSALMFPVIHLLPGLPLPQTTQKGMIGTWSRLYKAFARCSALVATAEENTSCEELCAKICGSLDSEALKVWKIYSVMHLIGMLAPHTPLSWVRKRSRALGNLATFHTLLVQTLEAFLSVDFSEASVESTGGVVNGIGLTLISSLSTLFTNITLPTFIQEVLSSLTKPLSRLFELVSSHDEPSKLSTTLGPKLEKLATDLLGCLQTQSTLHDDEMLAMLSPLLCVLFLHKSKQIRTVVMQFWNATFGNALTLTYPDPLKSVLSQVKQKTPLILPGFEAVDGESSQLDPQISGVKMSSVGKRDSLLARAEELKGRGSLTAAKPVSVKLDFGSPKPLRREAIEEEASVDFVFIPPETKERVLTEHQKEVKRTKRVDIPALYNNLDASLDTTVFSQYTQSQEESMYHQPEEESDEPITDVKVTQEGTRSAVETPEKDTQNKDQISEKNQSPLSDIPVDVSGHEKSGVEGTSPNVSSSSDMISGTPPKPNSRRQSFITLEKYDERKSPSPASVAFVGPRTRKSSRLGSSKASESTPNGSQLQTTKEDSEESRKRSSTDPSAQNEEAKVEAKDEMLTGGHHIEGTDEEEDDVVPDTQTQLSGEVSGFQNSPVSKANAEEQDSPEKDSQSDSQANQELRRSGRRRSKPLRPGEDSGEMKSKCQEQIADSVLTNTQKPLLSPTSNILTGRRRSKVIEDSKAEGDELNKIIKGEPCQSNSQISSAESSQAIGLPGNKELSQSEPSSESSPVTQSDSQSKERLPTLNESEGLSLGRTTRKTKMHLEESTDKEVDENSQNDSQNVASALPKKHSQTSLSDSEADSQQTVRTRRTRRSESQLLELSGSQTKDDSSQTDSQTLTMVKGRATRRRAAEEETDSTRDATSSVNAEDLSQDSSEGLGRYRTRRSKGLLASTDNPESEISDSREDGPRPKKRLRKPLSTEVLPVATEPKGTEIVADMEGVDVSIEMSQDEADHETSLNVSASGTKEEVPSPDGAPHEQITSEKGAGDAKIETDTDEKETITEKAEGEELNSSSQIGSEDLTQKTDILRKCPHTRGRGRGRRRSRTCNCFSNNRDVFSQDSDFQESQDLKNEQVPLVSDALNSQPEQSSSTSVSEKSKSSAISDVSDFDVQPFSALHAQLPSEVMPSESPIAKLGVIVSQLSEAQEGAPLKLSKLTDKSNKEHLEVPEAETNQLESSGCAGSQKHKEEEDRLENSSVSQEPLQSSTPQDTSPSQGRPVEDAPICQEQLESSHVQQEDAVNPAVTECEDLAVSEPSGEKVVLPEESNGKELLDKDVAFVEKDEDTPVDNRDLPVDTQESSSVPPQSSTSEACLDSPLKPKPLDALSGELEPGQSPSRNRSRVWSPSASPSTSILKKGQKRTCEEDTPSPLQKSRRVSFATPIYHQELADDIDRRSPVIRTSSPRSKVLSGQSKYITTPTKGYSSLSPRNLRSPGSKSSKKCLISEMSQEPRPIAKDCVYPALVGCSTPIEAVLPQISSNMWPRGFGQLVRARNIKTVGDLSALTPSEIKSLPIRSPKLSNVRKALKTYHEQQVFITHDSQLFADDKPSEVGVDSELMAEENKSCDLPSDVVALSGRLTSEELGRCSPEQLGLMHEHLSGMMRSIVTHMQARLLSNLDESLP
uniref:Replication timing regulatory factor 1 n=1 Tax=Cyprinus carpio TaxID=7962 RepID=A0A8C1ZYJ1_CYPCA